MLGLMSVQAIIHICVDGDICPWGLLDMVFRGFNVAFVVCAVINSWRCGNVRKVMVLLKGGK